MVQASNRFIKLSTKLLIAHAAMFVVFIANIDKLMSVLFPLQVNTVVFDKTGTLTIGKPVVVSAVLFSSYSMGEFCDLATAAEV